MMETKNDKHKRVLPGVKYILEYAGACGLTDVEVESSVLDHWYLWGTESESAKVGRTSTLPLLFLVAEELQINDEGASMVHNRPPMRWVRIKKPNLDDTEGFFIKDAPKPVTEYDDEYAGYGYGYI